MKFGALSLLALASASVASAIPITRDVDLEIDFNVRASAPDTQFDNNPIKKVDSHLQVFSVGGDEGNDVSLTLKSDTTLVDQDGRGIYVNGDTGDFGNVDQWGSQEPSKGFAIKDNHLVYNDADNWKACPSGSDKYSLANNDCEGGTGIALDVYNIIQ